MKYLKTKKNKQKAIFYCIFFSFTTAVLSAYNPTAGSEEKPALYSAVTAGGQSSVTGSPFGDTVPAGLAVNPSLAGAEQRPVLDASYLLLAGLKKTEKGFGHAANLAFLYPASWGTLAGSLNFLNSEFESVKLGTMAGLRFSYSKEVTEKFLIGAGLYTDIGKDWGLGADIGVLYKFGNLGFLKDSKLGVSITGIGKTYKPDGTGLKGEDNHKNVFEKISGSPAIFTPHAGFASTLVSINGFKLGCHFDMSLPAFQNFIFNTGLHLEMADMISFKTAWVFNALETKYKKQTYIPSFNLGVNIKINSSKNKDSFIQKKGWEKSELKPEFSAKPFYNGIWAFGAGVNMHLGLKDEQAPKIELGADENTPIYFSPNNDGENDAAEIPLKITDKRYVTSWSCEIKDSKGNTVRTLSNKVPLREMKDVKSFFKLLSKSKEAVEVPEILRWDGRTESGEIAEDGKYTFTVKAEDDNKNKGETSVYSFYIDKTPPELNLVQPENSAALIFSPDGDGSKDVFVFDNTGSYEDLWEAYITDVKGNVVKNFKFESANLKPIIWDGRNNANQLVEDGVYKYTVQAIDRAKNKTQKSLTNIIVDTNKPFVNIAINQKAFSPADSVKGKIELTPSIPITKGLSDWHIDIKNENNEVVKTYKGSSAKINTVVFDGKNSGGEILPEGKYKAFVFAEYVNGYKPFAETPAFILDITPPEVKVSSNESIFSPDGDGKIDSVIFSHNKLSEGKWVGEIYKASTDNKLIGEPIYKKDFGEVIPNQFEWTGRKNDDTFAEDGRYVYVVRGIDDAGNTSISIPVAVELNTEKADIILQSNYTAFSPNNDGIKDTIEFNPVVKSHTAIEKYSIAIKNKNGKTVKLFEGRSNPTKLVWDGKAEKNNELCEDGIYSAEFEVELTNKNKAKSVIPNIQIDTVFPQIDLQYDYMEFSPATDTKKAVFPIKQNSSEEQKWTARFVDSKNKTVRVFNWNKKVQDIVWDGKDDLGHKIADGKYAYIIEAEDAAGNKTVKRIDGIVADSREAKGYITTKLPIFSPVQKNAIQELSLFTNIDAAIDNWNVEISNVETGKNVYSWNSKKQTGLPKTFNWNGKEENTTDICSDGFYMATVYIEYKKGDIVTAFSEPFILSTKPPKLTALLTPKYFSPDNDGIDDDLFINLKAESLAGIANWSFEIREPDENGGRLFWKTSGKNKITDKLIWDGRSLSGEVVQSATDYPFTFTATDKAGLTSVYRGYVPVDILVINDGGKLKIAVPSIIFRANAADFDGLGEEIVGKNNTILKRVAAILNKFPEYQVQVEGHANTTTGTEKEEITSILPLSNLRAEAVKNILIKNNVRASRLSSVGMGSSRPVASLADKDNWWKNRRVEFILIKHKN